MIYNSDDINYLQRKCNGGYKFTKSQEKINHFMNIDDIMISAIKIGLKIHKRLYKKEQKILYKGSL